MNACEIVIGSDLYIEALELRYQLFFRKHDLPKETLMDEHEKTSKHFAIADGKALIAYGRLILTRQRYISYSAAACGFAARH